MAEPAEDSLDQRRKILQAELAAQRTLVARRLAPHRPEERHIDEIELGDEVGRDGVQPETLTDIIDSLYPRSMTMRLAQQHPALAVGLVALGATLLIRGRREQLEGILSMARVVEPWFSGRD